MSIVFPQPHPPSTMMSMRHVSRARNGSSGFGRRRKASWSTSTQSAKSVFCSSLSVRVWLLCSSMMSSATCFGPFRSSGREIVTQIASDSCCFTFSNAASRASRSSVFFFRCILHAGFQIFLILLHRCAHGLLVRQRMLCVGAEQSRSRVGVVGGQGGQGCIQS